MSLYNAKKVNDAYRITKFDEDLEVESSYITSGSTCECPAGVRDSCRHRQMLPEFVSTKRADSFWLLDWDDREWYFYSPESGKLLIEPPRKSWRRL